MRNSFFLLNFQTLRYKEVKKALKLMQNNWSNNFGKIKS